MQALEQRYAGDVRQNHYAELAHHAEYGGLNEKALVYFTLAGKMSFGLYQNHEAIEYVSKALLLLSQDQMGSRFELLADRVELFNRLGKRELQYNDLQTLETLAKQLGDETRLAKAWMMYANYHYLTGTYVQTIDYALRAFALPGSSMVDPELIFLARISWFLSHLRLGQAEDAMRLGQESILLAVS
jgi:tetratricopeptide (TPR) repeat protein